MSVSWLTELFWVNTYQAHHLHTHHVQLLCPTSPRILISPGINTIAGFTAITIHHWWYYTLVIDRPSYPIKYHCPHKFYHMSRQRFHYHRLLWSIKQPLLIICYWPLNHPVIIPLMIDKSWKWTGYSPVVSGKIPMIDYELLLIITHHYDIPFPCGYNN